jgi:hypothetical protein
MEEGAIYVADYVTPTGKTQVGCHIDVVWPIYLTPIGRAT